MKILLIDNFHYRRGGAEVVYLNTGDMLSSHGHKVIYFSQSWEQNIPCNYDIYFPKGIDVRTSNGIDRFKCIQNYFYNFDAARALDALLKREHPDIAHIHLFWGGLSPSILKVLKKHHIPIVHTAHDYRMVCPGYAFKDGKGNICEKCHVGHYCKCLTRKCAKGSLVMSAIMTVEMYFRNLFFHPVKYISSFIFVSEFSKKKHIEHDKRFAATNNKVMYNFSNSDVSLNVISGIDTFDSYFLYYGRLSHEKGVKTLIKAFALHKDKKLKIVGTGPLEEQLKQLCSELKLNNIEFLGYKVGAELYKIIQNAKYVCVPSECYENNPMTIIESYTLCVPVIGAAIGGITEIVLDMHTGFLFKAGDIFSLSENIGKSDQICKTEYSKMKLEAKKFAEDYFNVDKYYNSLIDFYNKTIQK